MRDTPQRLLRPSIKCKSRRGELTIRSFTLLPRLYSNQVSPSDVAVVGQNAAAQLSPENYTQNKPYQCFRPPPPTPPPTVSLSMWPHQDTNRPWMDLAYSRGIDGRTRTTNIASVFREYVKNSRYLVGSSQQRQHSLL